MYNRSKLHFTPWVEVIKNISNIPPEFQGHYRASEDFELLFAIPFSIDKFSFLVGVYDDHLYILKNTNDNIFSQKIFYNEIIYVKNTRILLYANFKIVTGNCEIEMNYNPVSEDIINKVMKKIRNKYLDLNQSFFVDNVNDYNLENIRYYFKSLFRGCQRENETLTIIGYQPEFKIPANNNKFTTKLLHLFHSPTLLASIFLQTEKEIIIYDSGKNFRRKIDDNYGYSAYYIPIANLTSIHENKNIKYNALSDITFQIKGTQLCFPFNSNNNEKNKLISKLGKLMQNVQ